MNAREMIEQEITAAELEQRAKNEITSLDYWRNAAERVIERQSAEIERLNTRLCAMMEGYDARGVLIDQQEAAIDTKDALIANREQEIACHKAELAAARKEIERLKHEVATVIADSKDGLAAALAEINKMQDARDGMVDGYAAVLRRAEAAEARCKVLEDEIKSCAECGGFHEIKQRDRRDRLDKFVHPFLEKMFLVMKKSAPDLTVLEFVLSVMQEIDAKCEEGR